jgi:aminoglycoside phosphotransferase
VTRRIVARVSLLPPEPIRALYAAWTWTVAWEWPDLATTWRLENSAADADDQAARIIFVKVLRPGHFPTAAEVVRMRWARAYLPVPEVFDQGSDGAVDWIVTRALAGIDACRRPLVGRRRRSVEHDLEYRPRLRRTFLRVVRHRT